MYQIEIELTKIDIGLYLDCGIEFVRAKTSPNNWLDVTLKGSKKNILHFLKEFCGEDENFFNLYAEKI